ncbi:hypothetical protein L8Y20_06240, partial [Campylobacter lari]|nr:hypothetical protein [Campylobacter lari]
EHVVPKDLNRVDRRQRQMYIRARISTTMKNLFKDMDEFKNYIDILEAKENTHNHYLSKIYNIA